MLDDTSAIPPATSSLPIFWESVVCSGTELTLLDCSYNSTGDGTDHSRDVIVHCQQREIACVSVFVYDIFNLEIYCIKL